MKMEIWITAHLDQEKATRGSGYPTGYQWELFDGKGKPIAKSSPGTGETYFSRKQSAITAAKRMRDLIWAACTSGGIPIYDMTKRGQKGFRRKLIK